MSRDLIAEELCEALSAGLKSGAMEVRHTILIEGEKEALIVFDFLSRKIKITTKNTSVEEDEIYRSLLESSVNAAFIFANNLMREQQKQKKESTNK